MKNNAYMSYLSRFTFALIIASGLSGCTTNSETSHSDEWHNLGNNDGIFLQGFDYPRTFKEPSESAEMKYSSGLLKLNLRMSNDTDVAKCAKLEFLKKGNLYTSAGDFEEFDLLQPGEIRKSGLVEPRTGPWKLDYVIHVREPQFHNGELSCEFSPDSVASPAS